VGELYSLALGKSAKTQGLTAEKSEIITLPVGVAEKF